MTAFLLRAVLGIHLATCAAYVVVAVLARQARLPRSTALWAARAAVVASITIPLMTSLCVLPLPRRALIPHAPVQVWSGGASSRGPSVSRLANETRVSAAGLRVDESRVQAAAGAAFAALVALCAFRAARARRKLARALAGSRVVRRVGRVEVHVSPLARAPFAAWVSRRALVVLDEETFAHRADRFPALRHELMHHRRGDARLALPWLVVSTLLLPSPISLAWTRLLRALEEEACDAAVVGSGVAIRSYVECLLRLAQRGAAEAPLAPALGSSGRTLRRRIIAMTQRSKPWSRRAVALSAAAVAAVLAASACASAELVGDRRVSSEEAAHVAATASDEKLSIDADPLVVEEVNHLVATPEGRAFTRRALERMKGHEAFVAKRLDEAKLPRQLAAIPIIESGYENLGAPGAQELDGKSLAPGIAGRGLWMFIPTTARAYGLRVEDAVDERLDIAKETDAAMHLLSELVAAFGDVRLALAAYNQGQRHVADAIARERTRDAWELVRRGALNRYAPKVYAAALVMAKPELALR